VTLAELPDVQNRHDHRGVALDDVGVRDIRYPITVLERAGGAQRTVGDISLSVGLPHDVKGTHMSRFVEALHEHQGELTVRTLPALLADLRSRLRAERARAEVAFPYFIERVAPASGARALVDYACAFIAEAGHSSGSFTLSVRVPVTSLCPCSKEISDYGAHNQRGHVLIEVQSAEDAGGNPSLIWIEELVDLAESAASSPVYSLLKRIDERHVTMQAYERPVFVEDIVRTVAASLRDDPRVAAFRIEVVNQESIHNHNAFARVSGRREVAPSGLQHVQP
jgi:GTP cyclohydrolase IB